jgi:flagellar hook-length control protein FliK
MITSGDAILLNPNMDSVENLSANSQQISFEQTQGLDLEKFTKVLQTMLEDTPLENINLENLDVSQFQSEDGSIDIHQLLDFIKQSGHISGEDTATIVNIETELAETARITVGEQQSTLKANLTTSDTANVVDSESVESNRLLEIKQSNSQASQQQGNEQRMQKQESELQGVIKKESLELSTQQKINNLETHFGGELKQVVDGAKADAQGFSQNTIANSAASLQLTQNLASVQSKPLMNAQTFELSQSVFSPDWSDSFKEQIMWLSSQQVKSAAIKLAPAELGPIEVSIQVSKEQTNINFNSHSPQVRDLIEHAIPKLREMFGEQGLNLVDVNVSADTNGQAFSGRLNDSYNYIEQDSQIEQHDITPLNTQKSLGLIDFFA